MPLKHLHGVDHVVVSVRDLDAAARTWAGLGFTVSPRGLHSPQMGTANHTIMLGEDYIELIGVVAETEHNAPTRALLKEREGIERTAFTTDDAAAGAAEVKARGIALLGPMHFGRPVPLPGGGEGEAQFNVFRWPVSEAPAGMRIFACQHLTREMVWLPELTRHANEAVGILRVDLVANDPKAAAEHMSRLTDKPIEKHGAGWKVASGGNRADFLFLDPTAFASLYPEDVRRGAVKDGGVALVLGTRRLDAVKAAVPRTIVHDNAVSVPAAEATSVIVSFRQA